ncbi:CoA ester lyase, partial [Pelomonas sp. KK5]|uniref:HpcH/HpaI aldolase/citrate lyase family protein n=1 Tax=Pelomonas sp. KK5 TaxID=1855730 RepID=UPI00097BA956
MDIDTPLARARTLLFVPGNRPERFDKALASGADAIVLDLEDSVPPAARPAAREAIAGAWPGLLARGLPLVVRINPLDGALARAELEWLAALAPGAAVMVPKANGAADLAALHARLPRAPLLPLVESAAGYANLAAIAGAPGVLRLVVGHLDFMADTGIQCSADEPELAPLRFAVAMHTRLQRLAAAVDGVTAALDDEALLRADTRRALRFGFGAKLCIHPRQVAAVHAALLPEPALLDWARRVLAADAAAAGAAV